MGIQAGSTILDKFLAKSLFIGAKIGIFYFYYSMLTLLVICFIVLGSISLIFIQSMLPFDKFFMQLFNLTNPLFSYFDISQNGIIDFKTSFNGDDVRRFVVKASFVIAVIGSVFSLIKNMVITKKKRSTTKSTNKKGYFLMAAIMLTLGGLSMVGAILNVDKADVGFFMIFIFIILLISLAALYMIRVLNRMLDAADKMLKLA